MVIDIESGNKMRRVVEEQLFFLSNLYFDTASFLCRSTEQCSKYMVDSITTWETKRKFKKLVEEIRNYFLCVA